MDAKDGALFDTYLGSEALEDFAVGLAEGAAAALEGLSKAETAKILIWLAVASTTIATIYEAEQIGETPELAPIAKINIPASGFASPIATTGCPAGAKLNEDSVRFREISCNRLLTICYSRSALTKTAKESIIFVLL
jgi:hypothetical protein